MDWNLIKKKQNREPNKRLVSIFDIKVADSIETSFSFLHPSNLKFERKNDQIRLIYFILNHLIYKIKKKHY